MSKVHQRRARAIRNAARSGGGVGAAAGGSEPGGTGVDSGASGLAAGSGAASASVTPAVALPGESRVTSPPREVVHVRTVDQATALAERLLARTVAWPVVVVTTPSHRAEPFIPVDSLLQEVRGLAELVLLPTGAASWAYFEVMPAMTQVYGGAGRVYAPDGEWARNPYRSPLRFAYGDQDGKKAAELLADDVAALTFTASAPTVATGATPKAGTVMGVIGTRVMVQLDDGGLASIWAESTVPGVAPEQMFAKGQAVEGMLDPDTRRLEVRAMVEAARAARQAGPVVGQDAVHVLVRIERVDDDGLTVELFPGETQVVGWDRAGGRSQREFYEPGDVVVATWWSEGGQVQLRLDLWSEEETVEEPPSILPGGPPWLVLAASDEPALDAGPEAGVEAARTVDPDDPTQVEMAGMARELRELRAANDKLQRQIKELRRRAQSARRRVVTLSPEEEFDYLVYKAWTVRLTASDRAASPLRAYRLGPRFITSVRELEGFDPSKIADVAMEVLTSIALSSDAREVHQWRISAAGGSPQRVDPETGAKGWRASLQRYTPSARRLHYWENPDGSVTFDSVGIHDDFGS